MEEAKKKPIVNKNPVVLVNCIEKAPLQGPLRGNSILDKDKEVTVIEDLDKNKTGCLCWNIFKK